MIRMSENYNGGIALELVKGTADVQIQTVQSYDVSYTTESESFQTWDHSTYTLYKGDRFTANITTGVMTLSDMSALRNFLLTKKEFTMYCPEYPKVEGQTATGGISVRLVSISQPLEVANYGRTYYRLSFSVAAVGLINNGGGL